MEIIGGYCHGGRVVRILLSFWDGGEGHLARIAYLTSLLEDRGHRCMIIASSSKAERARQLAPTAQIRTVENRPARPQPVRPVPPVYSHAFRHAQRRLALGFDDHEFIVANTQRILEVIRAFRPHAIVNDYHDTIRIAAEAAHVPLISIAMAHGLCSGPTLGAWKQDELGERPLPECVGSFNHSRSLWGLRPYEDERETFEGELNLVPSCPALDPLRRRDTDVYVGPVMNPPSERDRPPRRRPLVVSYLAEGNNRPPSPYPEALAELVGTERTMDFAILGGARYARCFNTGDSTGDSFLGMVPPQRYLELLGRADLVITHGGTTLVHAVERSVPVLCLPWTSSEAAWGVQVERQGSGILFPAYRRPLEWRVDRTVHPSAPLAGHWSPQITAEGLRQSVRRILDEPSYRNAAADLAHQLSAARSGVDLVDLVQSIAAR
ncbi:glycosyltransferase [Streptomyces sp. NPDC058391]|uniref:glycosyltransferase n=1 Tax=Streptomyces sp. NPDC058391 TaxID=3346476 RepID=UPI0036463CB8